MTRFVIDAPTAIRLVRDGATVDPAHQLVAPAAMRSHALQLLLNDVRDGTLSAPEGRKLLEGLAGQRVRLLADRVSRATAWRLAIEYDWVDVSPAEYIAVTVLQADALVTSDPDLRGKATGVVQLAEFDDLLRS